MEGDDERVWVGVEESRREREGEKKWKDQDRIRVAWSG